jgi:hypothetical protein
MVYFLPVSFMTNFKETTGCEICKKRIRSSRITMSKLVAWFLGLGFQLSTKKIISRRRNKTKETRPFRPFRGIVKTRISVSFRRIKRYVGFRFFLHEIKNIFVVHFVE